jgi:hypothetical protein
MDFIQNVFGFCRRVKNDRTILDAFNHMLGECVELKDEIKKVEAGETEGDDGIVGEAIDVMACALDIIWQHRPDITSEELNAIMTRKCEKWERKVAEKAAQSA